MRHSGIFRSIIFVFFVSMLFLAVIIFGCAHGGKESGSFNESMEQTERPTEDEGEPADFFTEESKQFEERKKRSGPIIMLFCPESNEMMNEIKFRISEELDGEAEIVEINPPFQMQRLKRTFDVAVPDAVLLLGLNGYEFFQMIETRLPPIISLSYEALKESSNVELTALHNIYLLPSIERVMTKFTEVFKGLRPVKVLCCTSDRKRIRESLDKGGYSETGLISVSNSAEAPVMLDKNALNTRLLLYWPCPAILTKDVLSYLVNFQLDLIVPTAGSGDPNERGFALGWEPDQDELVADLAGMLRKSISGNIKQGFHSREIDKLLWKINLRVWRRLGFKPPAMVWEDGLLMEN